MQASISDTINLAASGVTIAGGLATLIGFIRKMFARPGQPIAPQPAPPFQGYQPHPPASGYQQPPPAPVQGYQQPPASGYQPSAPGYQPSPPAYAPPAQAHSRRIPHP
ncbi:MAG: hypothetical protein KGO05_08605, partial [Chloroflexota bacterium]|nr:hypothetical protein [Chloroflexota bacterium]